MLDLKNVLELESVHTYFWYDGPLMWLSQAPNGDLYFSYLLDLDVFKSLYKVVYVPISKAESDALENKTLTLHSLMSSRSFYKVVIVDNSGSVEARELEILASLEELPEIERPLPDSYIP